MYWLMIILFSKNTIQIQNIKFIFIIFQKKKNKYILSKILYTSSLIDYNRHELRTPEYNFET